MVDFEPLLTKISAIVPKAEAEYMGEDGLLHCAVCHKATQCRLKPVPGLDFIPKGKIVRCSCDCVEARKEREKQMELQEEYERRRRVCFAETNMANWTFANDDRQNAKYSDAMMRYAENFEDFRKEGKGPPQNNIRNRGIC